MATVYFATNRNYQPTRAKPGDRFGPYVTPGMSDNLRFGVATLAKRAGKYKVQKVDVAPEDPKTGQIGSPAVLDALRKLMRGTARGKQRDTLVYVHGYNVSFKDAVQSAAHVQDLYKSQQRATTVVLFTWPSDGRTVFAKAWKHPFAYPNDRADAAASGSAFARAFLKLNKYMRQVAPRDACRAKIHLMAHSMGNYVLRHGLQVILEKLPGALPRLFDQILLMAADEDYDAFEHDDKFARLPELGAGVHVYFNRDDVALSFSDEVKFNPTRLGMAGPRLPHGVPANVTMTEVTYALGASPTSLIGHAYFKLNSRVYRDARRVLDGMSPSAIPNRVREPSLNRYILK